MSSWFVQNASTLLDGLSQGALLYLIAAGLTVIFGILGVLNLAHGALFALGAYLSYQFVPNGTGYPALLGVAVATTLVLTVLQYAAQAPIRDRGYVAQALLTLGAALVIGAVIGQIWGYNYQSISSPSFLAGSVAVGNGSFPVYYLAVIGLAVVVAILLWAVIWKTSLGVRLRATVDDRAIAAANGINVTWTGLAALFLGTFLAIFGGIAGAPILGASPTLADQQLVLALVVVVLGGIGSLRGAFIGAMVIGEVEVLVAAFFPAVAPFAVFGTMAVVLLVRPAGLFGRTSLVR